MKLTITIDICLKKFYFGINFLQDFKTITSALVTRYSIVLRYLMQLPVKNTLTAFQPFALEKRFDFVSSSPKRSNNLLRHRHNGTNYLSKTFSIF